jgi:outer membrane immunogenic protein
MFMKKSFLCSAALIVLAGAASAADMPTKMPLKAAPPIAYDWNGFYLGGYYADSLDQTRATSSITPGTAQVNQYGLGFGVTAGYNWQFDPRWLVGLEGDIGYLGINRTEQDWDDNILVGIKTDWYGTARARLGYVTGPSVLYATGGAAFVHETETFGGNAVAGAAAAPATAFSTTKTGWTAGGGIETKLSHNWSAKTEYLYIDAGSSSFGANVFGVTQTATFQNRFHVLKTGLNYKFGGPGPSDGILGFLGGPLLPSDHNWGGFYVGANVGGGISLSHGPGGEGAVPFGTETDMNGTGFAGGGQVGYNYVLGKMFLGTWFVGLEGDIGALSINSATPEWNDTSRIFSEKTNWYGTARARVGTTTGPALLYFTGGGAWVHLTDGITAGGLTDVASKTAGGWTFGGGTEVALDSRWSARLESLYIDTGHTNHAVGAVNADFKERFMVVRAGLNFKLGAPDVVTTKY